MLKLIKNIYGISLFYVVFCFYVDGDISTNCAVFMRIIQRNYNETIVQEVESVPM